MRTAKKILWLVIDAPRTWTVAAAATETCAFDNLKLDSSVIVQELYRQETGGKCAGR